MIQRTHFVIFLRSQIGHGNSVWHPLTLHRAGDAAARPRSSASETKQDASPAQPYADAFAFGQKRLTVPHAYRKHTTFMPCHGKLMQTRLQ